MMELEHIYYTNAVSNFGRAPVLSKLQICLTYDLAKVKSIRRQRCYVQGLPTDSMYLNWYSMFLVLHIGGRSVLLS
jgi:hypothetical protein